MLMVRIAASMGEGEGDTTKCTTPPSQPSPIKGEGAAVDLFKRVQFQISTLNLNIAGEVASIAKPVSQSYRLNCFYQKNTPARRVRLRLGLLLPRQR